MVYFCFAIHVEFIHADQVGIDVPFQTACAQVNFRCNIILSCKVDKTIVDLRLFLRVLCVFQGGGAVALRAFAADGDGISDPDKIVCIYKIGKPV